MGYSGVKIDVIGYAVLKIRFKERVSVGKVYVARRGDNLLGWRHQGDLEITLNPNSPEKVLQTTNGGDNKDIFDTFQHLFREDLGILKGFEHKIILKKSSVPTVQKVRRVPNLMLPPLKEELNKLLKAAIIEEIESSEWPAPVVLTPKNGGRKIMMCVDLRDLNKHI